MIEMEPAELEWMVRRIVRSGSSAAINLRRRDLSRMGFNLGDKVLLRFLAPSLFTVERIGIGFEDLKELADLMDWEYTLKKVPEGWIFAAKDPIGIQVSATSPNLAKGLRNLIVSRTFSLNKVEKLKNFLNQLNDLRIHVEMSSDPGKLSLGYSLLIDGYPASLKSTEDSELVELASGALKEGKKVEVIVSLSMRTEEASIASSLMRAVFLLSRIGREDEIVPGISTRILRTLLIPLR